MKILTNLTLAALAFIALNNTAAAGRIHSFDDLHEKAERQVKQAALIQQCLASRDPEAFAEIQAHLNVDDRDADTDTFQGKGHSLGGDKYVNRLLGIEHKEGKRLSRLAKKQARDDRKAAKKVKHLSISEKDVTLAIAAALEAMGLAVNLITPAA